MWTLHILYVGYKPHLDISHELLSHKANFLLPSVATHILPVLCLPVFAHLVKKCCSDIIYIYPYRLIGCELLCFGDIVRRDVTLFINIMETQH